MYWERFLIAIAKLLDPARQGNFNNLTLFTLPEILKEQNNSSCSELLEDVQKVKTDFKNVITYRKKNLAHFDSDFTTGSKSFDSSTHLDDVHLFLDEMINIINKTLIFLGHEPKSKLVIYPGRFKGARALNQILETIEIE
jgi:hypothetical protein